jgi:hypothetical protein
MKYKDTLSINAHLKYVEFLLKNFDDAPNEMTLGELRNKFKERYSTLHPLLNQNFGIYRLLPLILIKEDNKILKKESKGDVEKIKIIRDAISHHKFDINENGYHFKNDKGEIILTFAEFNDFLFKIENEYYKEKV